MENKYRNFCPKKIDCEAEDCSKCILTNNSIEDGGDDSLQHEINKAYLKSVGRVCLCCDCCDK